MHTLTLAAAGPSRCFVARWLGVSSRHSWYSRPSVSHPAAGLQGLDRARRSGVRAVGAGITSIWAECHNPGPCNCVVSIALIGGVPAAPVDAQHSSHRAAARRAGGRTDRDFLSICYRGLWSSGVSAAADSVWRATTVSLQGLPSYVIICAWLWAVASAQAASKQASKHGHHHLHAMPGCKQTLCATMACLLLHRDCKTASCGNLVAQTAVYDSSCSVSVAATYPRAGR